MYDQETGLYYLQSRYYNPDWGRFINSDVYVSTGQGILGNNMFADCNNNPVKRIDITGTADLCVTDGEDDNPLNDLGTIGRGSIAGNSNSGSFGNANCGVNTTGGANQNAANGGFPSGANGTTPHLSNHLSNISYTPKVINDMQKSDFHGFSPIVDNYGSYGEISKIRGGDGQIYSRLRIPGEYRGHSGYFEYIWNSDGICNHRCFIEQR